MATIHDLNVSIYSMNDQDAFELIKSIRFKRRMVKIKPKAKSKAKKPTTVNLKSLVSGMSEEARMKLLSELGG
jgi:hypothetical protein